MALSPIPHVVEQSGAASAAPAGAIPISLYGADSGTPASVAWGDITGKPTTFPPAAHAATLVNVAADATNGIAAGNLQAVLIALADRITALEP